MKPSLKITFIYLAAGYLWILLSDKALLMLMGDSGLYQLSYFQTGKGLFFVTITGVMLFLLVEHYYKAISLQLDELSEANKKLDEKAEKLEELNKDLEQFAYVTSHDLQEPLRMITSFLKQLERKYSEKLDDKALMYIRFASEGAARMKQIIEDIFDYYDIQKTASTPAEMVAPSEIVKECLEERRVEISRRGARIRVEDMPAIQTNPLLLHHLFGILLDNSLLYSKTDTPPEIRISAEVREQNILFFVEDNGIGIEEEYQKQIFLIFNRLHSKDQFSGTGIGLATASKIVSMLSGSINVESDGKTGSRFEFTLPAATLHKSENGVTANTSTQMLVSG